MYFVLIWDMMHFNFFDLIEFWESSTTDKRNNFREYFHFTRFTKRSPNGNWYDKAYIMMVQNQPSRCVLRKRCSKNIQQIYRRTPCRSAISIKLQSKFIEMAIWHECSPINLLHNFRTPFLKNSFGGAVFDGYKMYHRK